MNDSAIFKSLCREDFYSFVKKAFDLLEGQNKFVPSPYLELICNELVRCTKQKKRLVINLPPRSLKSFVVSICFVAYMLGLNPKLRILCVSYGKELANELSRKTKVLMESEFYKDLFGTRLGDKNTEDFFETTAGGYRYSTSIGGVLTGIGADIIIIDDPIKAEDALSQIKRDKVNKWYSNTLVTRLNNKKSGSIILVMQRLHVDDLSAYMLANEDCTHINLPAIATEDQEFILPGNRRIVRKTGEALMPGRESIADLEALKKTMSDFYFEAQYQHNPIPEKGNIINFADFKTYSELPEQGEIWQSWDIALKDGINNDYSVCITAKRVLNLLYILDLWRGKLELNDLINKIHSMHSAFNASHVIIEESSVSIHTLQIIRQHGKISPYPYAPDSSKEVRANNAAYYIREGRVLIPDKAHWLPDFMNEINAFPFGKHDDQVDSLSQLIKVVFNRQCTLSDIALAINHSNSNKSQFSSAKEMCLFAKNNISKRWIKTMRGGKLW